MLPKVVIFILFLAGLGASLKILFNSYRWIRTMESDSLPARENYRSRLRFECLRGIQDSEEKQRIWALTWGREIKDFSEELALLDAFLGELKQLQGQDLKVFHALLRIFLTHIEKRKIADWRVFDALFPKLLDWNYEMHSVRYGFTGSRPNGYGLILETRHVLNKLIGECAKVALKNGGSYPLFESLHKHVSLLGNVPTDKKQQAVQYLVTLFAVFCPEYFENIGLSGESDDIWRSFFPQKWKVTAANLKDSLVAQIWWVDFCRWSQERIVNVKTDYDPVLEAVSRELFPETDPICWADILRFLFSPWTNDERIASILKVKSNFGFAGRVGVIDDAEWTPEIDLSKVRAANKDLFENTIELAMLVGGTEFSLQNLEKYLTDLEKHKGVPLAEHYRAIFEAMKLRLSGETGKGKKDGTGEEAK
jgi:hypothetical protein